MNRLFIATAIASVCWSSVVQAQAPRGCEFIGNITGALATRPGAESFITFTHDVQAHVSVSSGSSSSANVSVLVEHEGISRGVSAARRVRA